MSPALTGRFFTTSAISESPNSHCCALSVSGVWLFVTPWTAACQAPWPMGILQARMLEWVSMPSSMGSSQHRDGTCFSCVSALAGKVFFVCFYHQCRLGRSSLTYPISCSDIQLFSYVSKTSKRIVKIFERR